VGQLGIRRVLGVMTRSRERACHEHLSVHPWCREFLGAFAELQKATLGFIISFCRSASDSSAPSEGMFVEFCTLGFFENLSRKFSFVENVTRITGTLSEHLCTFMIISR
jgi:hypothetical protein